MFRLFILTVALISATGQAHAEFFAVFQPDPPDRAHQRIAQDMARSMIPQRIADHLNSILQLPDQVLVQFQTCGEVNAYFKPQTRTLTFCYETQVSIYQRVSVLASAVGTNRQVAENLASGALWFVLMHEVGHAIHMVGDLPTLGRPEDIADQLATWLEIRRPPPGIQEPITGGMSFFLDPQSPTDYAAMGGVHSLHPQRLQNVACWAYGADPVRYRELPDAVHLPEARRKGCAAEWDAIDRAVPRLLGRILKPAKRSSW